MVCLSISPSLFFDKYILYWITSHNLVVRRAILTSSYNLNRFSSLCPLTSERL